MAKRKNIYRSVGAEAAELLRLCQPAFSVALSSERVESEVFLKLKRPPFPGVVGTAGYFGVHAGHRETAISHAIQAIKDEANRTKTSADEDPLMAALEEPIAPWVIESLIQGAWMREYHEWERATKSYFEGQHQQNRSPNPDWKGNVAGEASRVFRRLLFVRRSYDERYKEQVFA